MKEIKLIRTSTVADSINILLKGQPGFLNNFFEVITVSSPSELLNEVKDREGVRVISVPMERKINPYKDIVSLWRLYITFCKEKPTIVHSITPKAGLLSMLAAKMAGVPIRIHTFTGLIFPSRTGFLKILLIFMDKLLCWAATNIYPEGNGVKNDLINYKITYKPLKVIANGNVNGIDLDYFSSVNISNANKSSLRNELNLAEDDFTFIFVGRLVGDKGINELVEAFSKLKIQKVKLLLVGPFETDLDPLQPDILKEIEINPNILSVGFQKDVRPFFAISDALIFPSYREGFPNVVIQAGAMELPSIVSNINGCNEIIINGKNGIIVPSKNVEEIYKAMQKMISDNNSYETFKYHARAMIKSRYEQKVVWNALLNEYNRLLIEKGINPAG
ncbi:glycosyltransferase family 4 protein [Sphingobacterium spiritivorum]|uniref:glycosyltransferase family 4 protein n=1 Tax=Sphingobacterium spiritivorum TaxID=258 RepID=UPI003DA3780C